jgi:hypothetical protein
VRKWRVQSVLGSGCMVLAPRFQTRGDHRGRHPRVQTLRRSDGSIGCAVRSCIHCAILECAHCGGRADQSRLIDSALIVSNNRACVTSQEPRRVAVLVGLGWHVARKRRARSDVDLVRVAVAGVKSCASQRPSATHDIGNKTLQGSD